MQARRKRLLVFVVVGLLAVVGVGALAIAPRFQPASAHHLATKVIVPEGASVAGIGAILERRKVIRSAEAFHWYLRLQADNGNFKAGSYKLSPDMTLAQIIAQLHEGPGEDDDLIKITIPEGYTLRQIAAKLGEKGVTDEKKFLKLVTNSQAFEELHADFPLPTKTLEGYLFPDTYQFPPNSPPERIVEEMLLNFFTRFVRPYQQTLEGNKKSLHHLVTTASLIEREAKVPEDRARIAGVIANRLKKGMKLQIDATVLYALGHHKEKVYYKDLEVNSPYNTYKHKGLPPGPIANPGVAALEAALNPEKNAFLYYVARPSGAHIFTRTPEEHAAAIKQVRSERGEPETQPGG